MKTKTAEAASIEPNEGEHPLVEFNSLSDSGTWVPGIGRFSLCR
jgi:hypothetical protein